MDCPAERYAPSTRPYAGLPDLDYLFHDKAVTVTTCSRIYEAITIQGICDAADVGRSTFYTHYTSKDDLMRSGIENLRRVPVDRQQDALATSGDIKHRGLDFNLTLFEHARDHIDLNRGWSAAPLSPLASFARYSPMWSAMNLPQPS